MLGTSYYSPTTGLLTLCTPSDPHPVCSLDNAFIHYQPSIPGNALYLSLFATLLTSQLYFGIRYKTWGFTTGMVCGLVLEIVGYAGRLMLHSNPFDFNFFLVYLIDLTIAPAFLTASIYLCLARLITASGAPHLSRFSPRAITIFFICCDFFSLVLQAAGGGLTSTADSKAMSDTGVWIMVAGLAFQVASLAVFGAICTEFAARVSRCHGDAVTRDGKFADVRASWKYRGFCWALGVATIAIFIRSTFRVAELSGGFRGKLANDEITFMILEGPMIIIAVLALTIFHPGAAFGGRWAEAGWRLRGAKKGGDEEMEREKGSGVSSVE